VDPPIARNRSSQLGWSTAKGKKTLPNQRKMMMKFVDIAYPCIWAVLGYSTPSLSSSLLLKPLFLFFPNYYDISGLFFALYRWGNLPP
jgi:hypothetical protein